MSRATRFSVALHALALIEHPGGCGSRLTSEAIAGSVGTNASFVRRVLSMLARAGIVRSSAGIAGAELARPADAITLLEIYRAVGMEGESRLAIHRSANPACFVGRRIQGALQEVVGAAEEAFEAELGRRKLSDVFRLIAAQVA
ncbi:MAG TPA: Rrf2 family transcriptional regulator [Stellaceae bacterium]|nr:Rrf2 family transcriptional regulator [Stellaceae bacterium]